MIRMATVLVLAFALPAYASECVGGEPATLDELLEAERQLEQAESNIAKIAAFKTMLRTRDRDLLVEVIRKGLSSDNEAVRSSALRCKLLMSSQFTVRTLSFRDAKKAMPGLSEKAAAIVEAGQSWSLAGLPGEPDASCVSLYKSGVCDPKYSAVASGPAIAIRRDSMVGRFELDGEGRLIGQFTESTWHKTPIVPAELLLE